MTKFLIIWEVDTTKMPDKPKEHFENMIKLLDMVKKDVGTGRLDFGLFAAGGDAGYSVREGNEKEIHLHLLKYKPYVKFKMFPVLSADQALENVKKASQA